MKRFISVLLFIAMLISVTACGSESNGQNLGTESVDMTLSDSESVSEPESAPEPETEAVPEDGSEIMPESNEEIMLESQEEDLDMTMNIQIGDHVLTATLVQNSSTEALLEMLTEGPVTVNMSDYAGMEKVGSLSESLPRNDEQISTGAGDLILYQGNSFVIYYDTNAWSLTRLGKINDVTQEELKEILGSGDVTAVLSIPAE